MRNLPYTASRLAVSFDFRKPIIWEEVAVLATPSQQSGSYRPGKPLFD